jgi:hypothetical protein
MATPRYDALVDKVRDWSNKPEVNTIPDSVIEDCLSYSADECYRVLRIPPLETTIKYVVESFDNVGDGSAGLPYGNAYTSFDIPEDLIQFIFIRTLAQDNIGTSYSTYPSNVSKVFNEITDSRTFFDLYSEKYSVYNWMWKDGKIFIHPQLAVGAELEISYYRRLPALNATYSVIPVNYVIGLSDATQPYLTLTGVNTDTPLYFSTSAGVMKCFATFAEAQAYNPTVTTKYYTGKEVSNWLRDENERLLIWGALYNLGSYLFDEKMEQRYEKKFSENVFSLNKEEKWRRASGGNVQVNFNTNGLI